MMLVHFLRISEDGRRSDYEATVEVNGSFIWAGNVRDHVRGNWRRLMRDFARSLVGEAKRKRQAAELRRLRRLYRAVARLEGNRGWFSCAPPHDVRCQKYMGKGECECGADEYRAAFSGLEKAEK